mgnify:CR=1 FL=1
MTEEDSEVIGKELEGRVTNITHFGVFVRLDNGEDGLVHISEVADEFVSNIHDFVALGDSVKVKVLSRNNRNKLELSIKKAVKLESNKTEPVSGEVPVEKPVQKKNGDFERKMGAFLRRSEERQIFIKRNLKKKQGLINKKRV